MKPKQSGLLTSPISCRFHPQTKAQLESLARKLKMRPSEIIRQAVEYQLTTWKQSGPSAVAPRGKAGR